MLCSHASNMPANLPITRCVCTDQTFEALLQLADTLQLSTVELLAAAAGCTTGCGLCKPYIVEMLRTRATAFAAP